MGPNTDRQSTLQHSFLDDAQGLALGLCLCALGLHLLTGAGLITDQTVPIAFVAYGQRICLQCRGSG